MSWLRSSPLRQSFSRRTQDLSNAVATDTRAVLDSFQNHWTQIHQIIGKSEVSICCCAMYFFRWPV